MTQTENFRLLQKGDRVRYIPHHAHGDPSHPDCEDGVVTDYETSNCFFFGEGNVPVIYDNAVMKMTTGDEPYTAASTPITNLIRLPQEDTTTD